MAQTFTEDEVTANAKAAFKELRAKAERGETPELTLDEINEKIREVRRLRKERNGICSHLGYRSGDTINSYRLAHNGGVI